MGLETPVYINTLNRSNPTVGDGISQGDDHIRRLKGAILDTFPNITGAVNASDAEINYLVGVTSLIQTQINGKQASDAVLDALSGLTGAADKIPMFTSSSAATLLTLSLSATLTENSDTVLASQKAVKTYVDTALGGVVVNSATATPDATADYFLFEDATDSTQKKALLNALPALGVGQAWGTVSLASGTPQQNTSGKPIVFTMGTINAGTGASVIIEVSSDGVAYYKVCQDSTGTSSNSSSGSAIVPNNHYYKATYTGTVVFQSVLS